MMPFDPVGAVRAVVFALCLFFADSSDAHEWYPKDCCGERDCRPVPCEEIVLALDGVVSWLGHVVPKVRQGQYHKFPGVWPSPDGKCHVCPTGGSGRGYEAMCVFIPQKLSAQPVILAQSSGCRDPNCHPTAEGCRHGDTTCAPPRDEVKELQERVRRIEDSLRGRTEKR